MINLLIDRAFAGQVGVLAAEALTPTLSQGRGSNAEALTPALSRGRGSHAAAAPARHVRGRHHRRAGSRG